MELIQLLTMIILTVLIVSTLTYFLREITIATKTIKDSFNYSSLLEREQWMNYSVA